MPYIKQSDRRKYSHSEISVFENPGQLNFSITELLILYMKDKGLNYQTINDIVGALEGAKAEFYRQIAVPYEDIKILENGNVYKSMETYIKGYKI